MYVALTHGAKPTAEEAILKSAVVVAIVMPYAIALLALPAMKIAQGEIIACVNVVIKAHVAVIVINVARVAYGIHTAKVIVAIAILVRLAVNVQCGIAALF